MYNVTLRSELVIIVTVENS